MTDLVKRNDLSPDITESIKTYADATTRAELKRRADIIRDKISIVTKFFEIAGKEPNEVTISDVLNWHQWMLDEGKVGKVSKKKLAGGDTARAGLEDSTIYVRISILSAYYEWLMKIPQFAHHIKVNPARAALPKPPKKYNSSKSKSLTDEDHDTLWDYVADLAKSGERETAIRDYAIFTLFVSSGMRREEVLGLGAGDIRITDKGILIHALIKGGNYEWKIINDEEAQTALIRYLTLTDRLDTIGNSKKALWIRFDRGAEFAKIKHRQNSPGEQEPRLSSHAFDKQIKKYAIAAGIGHFHIHQFRHTFARVVAEEKGIIEAQDALGHADINTTKQYVKKIEFKKDKYSSLIANRRKERTEMRETEN